MLRTPVFENKICKICIAKYANFILFLSSLLISEGLFFDYEPEFRVSGTTPEWKIKPIQEIKLTDLRRYLPSKRRQMFLVPACFSFEGPPLRTNWKPQPCHERAYNHKSSRKSLELVTFLPCACLSFRDGPLETLWGGREFSSRRNFFSLLNSLYEFFLGHSMNIF